MNSYAFRHNLKSKKTDKILASANVGVCRRCSDKIEWRKKYRKVRGVVMRPRVAVAARPCPAWRGRPVEIQAGNSGLPTHRDSIPCVSPTKILAVVQTALATGKVQPLLPKERPCSLSYHLWQVRDER
jgi:hypothetical protein